MDEYIEIEELMQDDYEKFIEEEFPNYDKKRNN